MSDSTNGAVYLTRERLVELEKELHELKVHGRKEIAKLELTLSRVHILEDRDVPNDKVYILSLVTLKDLKSKRTLKYRLVSPEEANFEQNKISVTSPIGKGMIGKKVGDEVTITVPAGQLSYEILEINR